MSANSMKFPFEEPGMSTVAGCSYLTFYCCPADAMINFLLELAYYKGWWTTDIEGHKRTYYSHHRLSREYRAYTTESR